jgi:hypothetical protein
VDEHQLRQAFDEVFDQEVIFHGFADYMRYYDVYVYATADPRTGGPAHLRYRFTQCVRSAVTTSFSCRSSWTSMPPSNGWHAWPRRHAATSHAVHTERSDRCRYSARPRWAAGVAHARFDHPGSGVNAFAVGSAR